MSKSGLRTPDYLDNILAAAGRIGRYVRGLDEEGFLGDERTQDAVIRNIEVIGEAARNIERADPEFASAHPDVPWSDIYLMRNRLSHGYFDVDLELVWRTLNSDLPLLVDKIRNLRQGLGGQVPPSGSGGRNQP